MIGKGSDSTDAVTEEMFAVSADRSDYRVGW
jgi:hypothetical protein